MMDSARHVKGCQFAQSARVQHAFDGVASTIYQSLHHGTDASAPRVTAVPRSQWEHNASYSSVQDALKTLFDRDGFDAAKQFQIFFAPEHPVGWGKLKSLSMAPG
jgi:hypothetical protein